MKDIIEMYVLKNSIDFNGKANANAVLGRVLADHPEFKTDVRSVMQEIHKLIKEVEKISIAEQIKKLEKSAPDLLHEQKVVKQKETILPNAEKGKVVVRFAPSPSGPLHLGHAYVLSLNSELAKKYDGKLILRLEDTNPANIYDKAYTMIHQDAQWLTHGNVAEVIVQSDRLGHYYDYAEKLIEKGHAYVCLCNPDNYKRLLSDGKPCPCRNLPAKEQHVRYAKMFTEYKPGEAVMRMKTQIDDPNPAMRDFALLRINEFIHPRHKTQHRVWPLMNFSVAIDDHLLGVTHAIRGKDHRDNEKRQRKIAESFGWTMPVALFVGKINFTDIRLKTSVTKKEILEKKYSGWDDIRLPFLLALKRRGYQPDAFIKYAMDVGLTETDKKLSKQEFFKAINNFNKEIIDSQANRYFFVADPVEITIDGAPEKSVQVPLHPSFEARGYREFKTHKHFIISSKDYDALAESKLHRLMECVNFTRKGSQFMFDSLDHPSFKNAKNRGMIIHWLPKGTELCSVEVMLEDGSKIIGKCEHRLKDLPEGSIVQFERFGFCRLDKKHKNHLEFWFTHQ
ncbi:MAG TPA: glutamate--tRNA ligase [Candidatus Nanoarchaeia archaeon]|nr:glutamate--tRNA ligase [Candidatus Nanoarchaeia archaeon]